MRVNVAGERRRAPRGSDGEPPRAQLMSRVLGTYNEMPGLSLNLQQAARLFGVRDKTCEVLLEDLVRSGYLRRMLDDQYGLC